MTIPAGEDSVESARKKEGVLPPEKRRFPHPTNHEAWLDMPDGEISRAVDKALENGDSAADVLIGMVFRGGRKQAEINLITLNSETYWVKGEERPVTPSTFTRTDGLRRAITALDAHAATHDAMMPGAIGDRLGKAISERDPNKQPRLVMRNLSQILAYLRDDEQTRDLREVVRGYLETGANDPDTLQQIVATSDNLGYDGELVELSVRMAQSELQASRPLANGAAETVGTEPSVEAQSVTERQEEQRTPVDFSSAESLRAALSAPEIDVDEHRQITMAISLMRQIEQAKAVEHEWNEGGLGARVKALQAASDEVLPTVTNLIHQYDELHGRFTNIAGIFGQPARERDIHVLQALLTQTEHITQDLQSLLVHTEGRLETLARLLPDAASAEGEDETNIRRALILKDVYDPPSDEDLALLAKRFTDSSTGDAEAFLTKLRGDLEAVPGVDNWRARQEAIREVTSWTASSMRQVDLRTEEIRLRNAVELMQAEIRSAMNSGGDLYSYQIMYVAKTPESLQTIVNLMNAVRRVQI